MIILLLGVLMLMLAFIVTVDRSRSAHNLRSRAEREAMQVLAATGLVPSGDALGTFALSGAVHGIDVELTNRVSKRPPGPYDGNATVCVAYAAAPIADQIVCRLAQVDQIMGPLPMVPRIRTNHAQFDAEYAVFVGSAGEPIGASYRSASNPSAAPWAQPSLLDRLLEFDLQWLRVQGGRVELVFRPLPAEAAKRVGELIAAVALASHGKAIPVLAAGNPGRWVPWEDSRTDPIFAWILGAILGLGAGILVTIGLQPDMVNSVGSVLVATATCVLAIFSFDKFTGARSKS